MTSTTSAGSGISGNREQRTAALIARLAEATPRETKALREALVEEYIPVVDSIVSRYKGRGMPTEDLRQVGYLALVKAVRGFDTSRGTDFLGYLVPTVRGEVRRHFRDRAWMIRPPRRVQELHLRLQSVIGDLTQELGRTPRPSELAQHLGESLGAVEEALMAGAYYAPGSLDAPAPSRDAEGGASRLQEAIGRDDPGLDSAEARTMLAPQLRALPERDWKVLRMRYQSGWTQQEIGESIGVTQMQVSRILKRIHATLQARLEGRSDPDDLMQSPD